MPKRNLGDNPLIVLHVFNRSVRGTRLFEDPGDYQDFERILSEAIRRTGMRLLAYCLMPTHWHLVVWPSELGQLPRFMHWVSSTHAKRWQIHKHQVGTGGLYQHRYRAIPVRTKTYFLTVCRYVERNALAAGLVERAEEWPWSSVGARRNDSHAVQLAEWPEPRPQNWLLLVNTPQNDAEVMRVRNSVEDLKFERMGYVFRPGKASETPGK